MKLSQIVYAFVLTLLLAACSQTVVTPDMRLESQALQIRKLTITNAKPFGHTVAIDGDLMAVGAHLSLGNRGAVFLYQRSVTGVWQFIKRLSASDAAINDAFGGSVAISGDTVVVGAWNDTIGATFSQGSAYVFQRNQGGPNAWGQVKKLVASDGNAASIFGWSLSISNSTIVVGAYMAGSAIDDDFPGAAYIYERDQGGINAWGQAKKLVASDANDRDLFGLSVAISADTIVVGAPGDATRGAKSRGSIYIFGRNQGGAGLWGEARKILASDGVAGDFFGNSVAIHADTIAVAAPIKGTYIFGRNQGGANLWGLVKKLLPSLVTGGFYTAAIQGDTLVLGVASESIGTGFSQGAAYTFLRNQGGANQWGQVQKLVASDRQDFDAFGSAVALSNGTIVIGASQDDVGTIIDQGSVYIFK